MGQALATVVIAYVCSLWVFQTIAGLVRATSRYD